MLLALMLYSSAFGGIKKALIMTPDKIPQPWLSCHEDSDCGVGIMGCWVWVPINKTHLASKIGIFDGHYIENANISCLQSTNPGAAPIVKCAKGKCQR